MCFFTSATAHHISYCGLLDLFPFSYFLLCVLVWQPGGRRPLHIGTIFQPRPEKKNSCSKTDAHFQPIGQKVGISLTWSVAANLTFPSLIMNSMQCSLSRTYPNWTLQQKSLLKQSNLWGMLILHGYAIPLNVCINGCHNSFSYLIQLNERVGKYS